MPIIPLLQQAAFEPEMIDTLAAAFETAWNRLERSGSKLASPAYRGPAQEILARRIIEMTQHGERDPSTLIEEAVTYLERSYA